MLNVIGDMFVFALIVRVTLKIWGISAIWKSITAVTVLALHILSYRSFIFVMPPYAPTCKPGIFTLMDTRNIDLYSNCPCNYDYCYCCYYRCGYLS